MANDKIHVALLAKRVTVNGTNNKVVLSMTVRLTRKGKGKTSATVSPQDAELSFFELAGAKDAATAPRKIATLTGKVRLSNSKPPAPIFDVDNAQISYESFVRAKRTGNDAPSDSSDFRLRVTYDSTFENVDDSHLENRSLFLPWEFDKEQRVLELGAELKIAGAVESPLPNNASITVPLTHTGVHDDGNSALPKRSHFGVGMVYPLDNLTFGDHKVTGPLPMPSKTIDIFLHDSIDGQATVANVRTHLQTIFSSAGVTANVHTSQDDAAAHAAGWRRKTFNHGTAWVADNIPEADLNSGTTAHGNVRSFFHYWVFYERIIQPFTTAEAGSSEAILSVDKAQATKKLMFPIWLHGGVLPGAVFDSTLASITKGKDEFVANLVAHEVGHSLGLGHGLQVTASGYDLTTGSVDKVRGIVTTEHSTGGQVVLKRISPVHAEVLRRDYL